VGGCGCDATVRAARLSQLGFDLAADGASACSVEATLEVAVSARAARTAASGCVSVDDLMAIMRV